MIALNILRGVFVVGLLAFGGLLAWGVMDAQRSAAICEEELAGTWTRIGCIVGDFKIIDDPASIHSRSSEEES